MLRDNVPMKRIVLRVSALATVLVLGLMAIAQAQRGVKEASGDDSAVASEHVGSVVAAGGSASGGRPSEPGLLPQDPNLNPLRPAKRTFPTDGVRAAAVAPPTSPLRGPLRDDVVPAAATEKAEKPSSAASEATPKTQVDPFGLRSVSTEGPASRLAPGASGSAEPPRSMSHVTDQKAVAPARPAAAADLKTAASSQPDRAAGPNARSESDTAGSQGGSTPGLNRTPSVPLPRGASPRQPSPLELARKPLREPSATALESSRPATSGSSANPASEPGLLNLGSSNALSRVPRPGVNPGASPAPSGSEPALPDPGRAELSRAGEGSGTPGQKQLEGPQAPQLTLHKIAPPEVQVGKPATFQIKLKNTGPVAAANVEIRDVVPKGARLVSTSPRANPGVRGELVWQLGTVKPGDEVAVEVQIMPIDEGELGSVATVSFSAEASARTIATKPQLVIKTSAPSTVLIGDEVPLSITVSNVGSGVARKVVVEERVPPGLQHSAGPELEYEVGDLKPNESRQVELKLTAVQPGAIVNLLVARGDTNLKVEDRVSLEILAPQLQIGLEGPKRRFLEREATYKLSVSNPGTAPAKQVEIVAQLPTGLKFVSATNSGQYHEATRSVHWLLEELPVKETGAVEFTTMPVEIGEQTLRLRGAAEKGLAAEKEHPVVIEGIAAIMFTVVDTHDPVEVNGQTTYEIRVVNQGSKAATNVQVAALLPGDMRAVAAEGPAQHTVDGTRVVFDPLPRLAPKADTTFRVRVQGLKPGDQRVSVQLLTDEIRVPITKEESTRVYSDE